ncbi:MAG TPA: UDP-3-O-(3-hydroxymyristoyl)glucosamine N-acyltransferase, partial [Pyrinomonadaceae bacterium]
MSADASGMTVTELAARVGGRVEGDGGVLIRRVASLESAGEGEIAFVEGVERMREAAASRASCLIVQEDAAGDFRCAIKVARPKLVFALIAGMLHPPKKEAASVHPSAAVAESALVDPAAYVGPRVVVGERARVGAGTQVMAGSVIGDGASVGRDCLIYPNVVLYENVTVGDRVTLHAGVIIGADGFGYVPDENNFRHKFPQIGSVVIEDDVEIGANTCVDRGALGRTRIGRGAKIDNLVQVAHNVRIGERVIIASQTGISGSTVIEDDAVIGGQVGMGDHVRV